MSTALKYDLRVVGEARIDAQIPLEAEASRAFAERRICGEQERLLLKLSEKGSKGCFDRAFVLMRDGEEALFRLVL